MCSYLVKYAASSISTIHKNTYLHPKHFLPGRTMLIIYYQTSKSHKMLLPAPKHESPEEIDQPHLLPFYFNADHEAARKLNLF